MKHYCVDCMDFLTRIVYADNVPKAFDTKKIQNAIKKRGRAVIFWCRITGAYYLNTYRVYELPACKKFHDAGRPPGIQINIDFKRKG